MLSILFLVAAGACLGGIIISNLDDEGEKSLDNEMTDDCVDEYLAENDEGDLFDTLLNQDSCSESIVPAPGQDWQNNEETRSQDSSRLQETTYTSNAPVLTGSQGSDQVLGGDASQTLYHTDTAFNAQLAAPHHLQVYSENTDGVADTLHGGGGDDTIFFGTGDQVYGGDGADVLYGFLDLSDDTSATTLADFNTAEDKLVIFLPQGSSFQGIEQIDQDASGTSFTILTSGGAFTFEFPNITQDLDLEVIDERFDPDQHPLLFVSKHASLNSNIFILQDAGFV